MRASNARVARARILRSIVVSRRDALSGWRVRRDTRSGERLAPCLRSLADPTLTTATVTSVSRKRAQAHQAGTSDSFCSYQAERAKMAASSMPDKNYFARVVVDLARVTSTRSGDARDEYRGDKRDDETIKDLQKLMDAKKQGKLPEYLFKPQRYWYAHGHGIFSRFRFSSKT